MANDRWEFCYLTKDRLTFCASGGKREVKVRDFEVAAGQLGEQGWELAATSCTMNDRYEVFFKRRMQ